MHLFQFSDVIFLTTQSSCQHPQGSIGEVKTAPKSIPKRPEIEVKHEEAKNLIQDDLGPVLGRFWVVLGIRYPVLGMLNLYQALYLICTKHCT